MIAVCLLHILSCMWVFVALIIWHEMPLASVVMIILALLSTVKAISHERALKTPKTSTVDIEVVEIDEEHIGLKWEGISQAPPKNIVIDACMCEYSHLTEDHIAVYERKPHVEQA